MISWCPDKYKHVFPIVFISVSTTSVYVLYTLIICNMFRPFGHHQVCTVTVGYTALTEINATTSTAQYDATIQYLQYIYVVKMHAGFILRTENGNRKEGNTIMNMEKNKSYNTNIVIRFRRT
jgi:hypothetical protein